MIILEYHQSQKNIILFLKFQQNNQMGNHCSIEGDWCQNQDIKQEKTRQQFLSAKLSQKDLIQTKKHPISDDYVILSPPIGKGSFGSVYKIVNKMTGMVRAAKKISISEKSRNIMQEICIMKKLDHPNIVRIVDIYEQELFIYVVMEMCLGGELFDRIVKSERMSESAAKNYMKQLLSAVAYCHSNKIMHRDLKPENIMLVTPDENDLKIIDFGAGKFNLDGETNTAKVGSIYYIAPEVIKKNHNQKCDIWSLGVILYMMLSGSPPFYGPTDKIIFEKIIKGVYSFPEKKWAKISNQAKDLIGKMLQYDPQKRISASQCLKHKWLNNKTFNEEDNLFLTNEMKSIKKFCEMNRFQATIMAFISHNLLTNETISRIEKKFMKMDKNKDGKISWSQFRDCYKEAMYPLQEDKIRQIFDKLVKKKSSYIYFSDFLVFTIDQEKVEGEELLSKAFNLIDKDGDGYLVKDEIVGAFGGTEESIHDEIMNECDLNQDGKISRSQFMTCMRKISAKRCKYINPELQISD